MSFLTKFMNWLKQGKVTAWKASNSELDASVRPDLKTGNTLPSQAREGEYKGLQVKLPWPGEKQ
jgi:hypothetical protein